MTTHPCTGLVWSAGTDHHSDIRVNVVVDGLVDHVWGRSGQEHR
jgi:hypothetical protein